MLLSTAQRRFFHDQGYLMIRGAVPPFMVRNALQSINHSLGQEGMNKDDLPTLRAQSYCKEIRGNEEITDLFMRSSNWRVLEALLGVGNVLPASGGQIALRFPGKLGGTPGAPSGHLDGIGTGLNGMPKGTFHRGFTALAVCLLSDLPEANAGNFTVWPRSHLAFAEFFKNSSPETLKEGMPNIALPEGPLQVTGQAGDICIAHHLTMHTAAPNASPHIRYAAIFRVLHKDVKENGTAAMSDPWREWPGIQEILAPPAAKPG